jgi:hypothetical protein
MTTKKDLQDAIDSLVKQGKIEQIGMKNGRPLYSLTEYGRQENQLTQYTVQQLKAMGAPFPRARIIVSLKNMRAEVNFLVYGKQNVRATVQIPVGSAGTISEAGEAIAESAVDEGLIAEGSEYEIYDGDASDVPAAPEPESAELQELRAAAAKLWPSLKKKG